MLSQALLLYPLESRVFSPFIAWFVSQPSTFQDTLDISSEDKKTLRHIARRTCLLCNLCQCTKQLFTT